MNDTLGAGRGEAVKVRLRLHNPVSDAGPNMTEDLSRVARGSLLLPFFCVCVCRFRKATQTPVGISAVFETGSILNSKRGFNFLRLGLSFKGLKRR